MYDENLYKDSIPSRTKLMETMFAQSTITALVSGAEYRADSASTIEVDAGEIFVSDTVNKNFKFQPVLKQTGIPHAAVPISRIDLLSNGEVDVVPFTGLMTEKEKVEGKIQIGIMTHIDLVNIDEEFITLSALFGMSIPGNQDMFATGIRSSSGLNLVLNADLTFGSEAGTYIDPLAPDRYVCPEQPYLIQLPSFSQYGIDANTSMLRTWFGNAGAGASDISPFVTTVDPNVWDDPAVPPGGGSAPTEALTGLESQNIAIQFGKSKSGLRVVLQYGRIKFAKMEDAIVGAANQVRDNSSTILGTRFGGIISLKRGATDMTDPTQAFFTPPVSILVGTT